MNEDKLNDVADFYTALNLHQFHQDARNKAQMCLWLVDSSMMKMMLIEDSVCNDVKCT